MAVLTINVAGSERSWGHEEEASISTTPTLLAPSATSRVTKVVIQVLEQDLIIRDDGNDPTLTRGLILRVGDIFVVEAYYATLLLLKGIARTGTSKVRTSYYGY